MSKKDAKVPSIYGPVDVELFLCDGPECSNCVMPKAMVGWLVLGYQGVAAPTMGSMPDAMDFCSFGCLTRALQEMGQI